MIQKLKVTCIKVRVWSIIVNTSLMVLKTSGKMQSVMCSSLCMRLIECTTTLKFEWHFCCFLNGVIGDKFVNFNKKYGNTYLG